ncbi:hypothetical protein C8Q75DRAFT_744260 [Abortiporus biennis]|nr:hypothetical protein C8Q75DRAFT_744260 [Abortiporus biennis]
MGTIISSLGDALNAIVIAVWTIVKTVLGLVVTLVVTFFDIVYDIVCCNCFGNRPRRTGTHTYKFNKKPNTDVEATAAAPTTEPAAPEEKPAVAEPATA